MDTNKAFDQSAYQIEDLRRMSAARNYFAWQGRLITRETGKRVLEYGCGTGNITSVLIHAKNPPEQIVSVDPDPECTARLIERYPAQANLRVLTGDPRDMLAELRPWRFDTVVSTNVLEHIEDDHGAVATMTQLLEPGGAIILFVPAFPALFGPTDHLLAHARRYTRRALQELAASTGLRVSKLHYVNIVGFFGWWVNAHVLRLTAQSPAQIAVFDRVIVPVMSRLEEVAAPPFGQSLFAVLEKPR
jgi:SAM-dependent methyltransferase